MSIVSIIPSTPLGLAIATLFARALPLLDGQPAGSVKVYIFGGCAVHLHTQTRGSADVDAEIVLSPNLSKSHILAVLAQPEGYVENGRDLQIYLDENYNNSLGPLHEDYRDRAVPLRGFDSDKPIQTSLQASSR